MFPKILKRRNFTRCTICDNISRSTRSRGAVTDIRNRTAHSNGQRGITSKILGQPCRQTYIISFPCSSSIIRSDSNTRRKKVTVAESIDIGSQQQLEQHIPEPTWSLEDLELTSTHTAIAEEELERLGRLVLLDVSENRSTSKDEMIDSMKQDLGNMLNMIQRVTVHDYQESKSDCMDYASGSDLEENNIQSASAATYDSVRGLTTMPLRKESELDPLQAEDASQSRDILEKTLQTKMIRRGGGHKYFAIKTTEP